MYKSFEDDFLPMNSVTSDTQQDGGSDVPPSIAVVEAVAERDGVDASTLDPPLNTVVDGDALDSLFAGKGEDANAVVEFSYRGYVVVIGGDGAVTVADA